MKLEDRYKKLKGYVQVLLNGNISSLFLLGDAGIGKSYQVIKTLNEMNAKYTKIAGHITPIKLYNTLYAVENNDTEVIVFDDTYSIMKSEETISLLMASLWSIDGVRTVDWLSSSKALKAPQSFQFTKKVILIQNNIPKTSSLYPLCDRAYSYTLKFNRSELIDIMYEIAKKPSLTLKAKERKEIVDFIVVNSSTRLSLRTQMRLEDIYYYYPNWKLLAIEELKAEPALEKVMLLLKKHKTIKGAEEEFIRRKLGCRRNFYNLKKRLR